MLKKIQSWFAPMPTHGDTREMWPSRAAFLFAAIGSSVGLGNVWRFPALAYKFGGGSFFVPYFLALFLIGIPILALELSVGQLFRSGDVVAFSRISHRLRGLGLSSIFCAYIVNTYYTVLLSWIAIYFFRSFATVLPWTKADPMSFFRHDVLHGPLVPTEWPEIIVGSVYGCLIFTWLAIYFCLWKGVMVTGKIAYVTMTLPILFIIVLFFRGITLPGAGSGIQSYVGQFDIARLSDPLMWSEAVGQIFFSIGIAFGSMSAYASYNNKFQNTTIDALIIGISNSVYEIFCGFAVFGVVGYLRQKTGKDVETGGFGLAFATYPVAFSELPGAQFWCAFFFVTLFILGIDSAFSMVEGTVTVLKDSRKFHKVSREFIVGTVCVTGFLIGALYCTESGYEAMDAVDYFVNNIGIMFVGLFECVGATYFYKFGKVSAKFLALILGLAGSFLGLGFGFLFGGLVMCAGLGVSMSLAKKDLQLMDRAHLILFGHIEELRSDINENCASDTTTTTRLPFIWSFCLKFVCVPALFILLTMPLLKMAHETDGDHIPRLFRWLGLTFAFTPVLLIAVGMAVPRLFLWLMPPHEDQEEHEMLEKIDKITHHDSASTMDVTEEDAILKA